MVININCNSLENIYLLLDGNFEWPKRISQAISLEKFHG